MQLLMGRVVLSNCYMNVVRECGVAFLCWELCAPCTSVCVGGAGHAHVTEHMTECCPENGRLSWSASGRNQGRISRDSRVHYELLVPAVLPCLPRP